MCGLLGVVSHKKSFPEKIFDQALNTLHHRGPNESGHWQSTNGNIHIGHTRLSLVAPLEGQQPFFDNEQQIVFASNSEFYNLEAEKKFLQSRGHLGPLNNDNEIAFRLYLEKGLDFLTHLRGEFSCAILHVKQNKLILIRDRFGIKPLHYHHNQEGFFFSSEAKTLFNLGIRAEANLAAFQQAWTTQYPLCDETYFKNVKQVKPGHILVFEKNSVTEFPYWDLDYSSKSTNLNYQEAKEELKKLVTESINIRLRGNAKIATHLSGGLDSSIITAITQKQFEKPLDSFCVSYQDATKDEFPFAQQVAKKINCHLHSIPLSDQIIAESILDAVKASEGLAANGHLSGKYVLNQAIKKQGYSVILTGEGSDELFLGYPHLKIDLFGNNINNYQKNQSSQGDMISNQSDSELFFTKKIFGFEPHFLLAKFYLGKKIESYLDSPPNFLNSEKRFLNQFHLKTLEQIQNKAHFTTYLWCKSTLCNYILKTLGDGCEMAHSIEGRIPFLDHHLFEFTKTLPVKWLISSESEKNILRDAFKNELPVSIMKRPKNPFSTPLNQFQPNKPLGELLFDLLNSDQSKFFNREKIKSSIEKEPNTPLRNAALMMILTSLALIKSYKL